MKIGTETNSKKTLLLAFTLVSLMGSNFSGLNAARAQAALESSASQSTQLTSVRRNIATVILCGLGGAVVGLSTLSFYGQPQDHIDNISVGFALGLIAGTAYLTMPSGLSMKDQAPLNPLLDLQSKNTTRSPPMYSWYWEF